MVCMLVYKTVGSINLFPPVRPPSRPQLCLVRTPTNAMHDMGDTRPQTRGPARGAARKNRTTTAFGDRLRVPSASYGIASYRTVEMGPCTFDR
ncbi:unnamed protein product [Pseudo-nitzschia multistriata]|uniref:Uncharacterized protein n=1 Tax=Pseudo-nitzschia multistriata TaxID=183589 RepID=A0A448ZIQ9_9STRA|nr:unnamed protein product [Pseudo-nitzschia multistriata]